MDIVAFALFPTNSHCGCWWMGKLDSSSLISTSTSVLLVVKNCNIRTSNAHDSSRPAVQRVVQTPSAGLRYILPPITAIMPHAQSLPFSLPLSLSLAPYPHPLSLSPSPPSSLFLTHTHSLSVSLSPPSLSPSLPPSLSPSLPPSLSLSPSLSLPLSLSLSLSRPLSLSLPPLSLSLSLCDCALVFYCIICV